MIDYEERFWNFVQFPQDLGACWDWRTPQKHGYGTFKVGNKNLKAHRVAYELTYGPIPEGLVIDHLCHGLDASCPAGFLCRHRRCVNPMHLEAVAFAENVRRGRTGRGADRHRAKTHCPQGHPYDEQNTYHYRTCRQCRICRQARNRARKKPTKNTG